MMHNNFRTNPIIRNTAWLKRALQICAVFLLAITLVMPDLQAQTARRQRLIRDAEIEGLVRDYLRPILNAAGLGSASVKVHLINDKRFNAFVVDSSRMFIHTGTLLNSDTPNEVIGVLAHETGHIAGGHLARRREALAKAQTLAVISSILGAGATAVGVVTGSDAARAGIGVAAGGSEVAKRSFLRYIQTEELSADRAAFKYLQRTRQSTQGMLKTFRKFQDQAMFTSRHVDPYVQSHPMPRERFNQLESLARRSRYFDTKDAPALQARHDLMRAKISAFTEHPSRVARRYKKNDKSLPAQYAKTIVEFRFGKPKRAIKYVDALIRKQPRNPFFRDLKGQILVELGTPGKAIKPYEQALALSPQSALIRISLGQAMVASNTKRYLKTAIQHLRKGLAREPDYFSGYNFLARAYARTGQQGLAKLATASAYFGQGRYTEAKRQAKFAQKQMKRGTASWLQAEDILTYKPPRY